MPKQKETDLILNTNKQMSNTKKPSTQKSPMVLIILDGFGERKATQHNAIRMASTPTLDRLYNEAPIAFLEASGTAVGLPPHQIGNSEVGHLHIGAGRKIPQTLSRINQSVASGQFFENQSLQNMLKQIKQTDHAVHLIGLLSEGGVHSHEKHILAMIEMVHQAGIQKNYLHAILDGRDTSPRSALSSVEKAESQFLSYGKGQGNIASLIGRYYAMDRDNRWERTQKAYDLLTTGDATYIAATPSLAIKEAYARNESDEFISPTLISSPSSPPVKIQEGDCVIFMNFRADRARQLSYALTKKKFDHFNRLNTPHLSSFITLTQYAKDICSDVLFPPFIIKNTLGEIISKQGYQQLRLAETEKYAHVTYFLNGGQEKPYPLEDRLLVPSPPVATYDLQPEMSAPAMTKKLIQAIKKNDYHLIVCNFANPDMIGHTGNEDATMKAITVLDQCLSKILEALAETEGEALITADHGNAETMYDEKKNQPHTAHTCNPVPLIYVGHRGYFHKQLGALDDVAPTLLSLMGIPIPDEMTGENLITLSLKIANKSNEFQ